MNKKWAGVEKMLLLSLAFSVVLIAFRMVYSGKMTFLFITWNLFLAVIPLLLSRTLKRFNKINIGSFLVLGCWILFLPNAPYLVTDIIHFTERPPVSKWFDLLLITSAAWNGLILGVVSLMQVEAFLEKYLASLWVNLLMFFSIFICSFGIYVGRFLRYNSWDVLTDPTDLVRNIVYQFIRPYHNSNTWAFTILFGVMLWIFYYTIKKLPELLRPAP